MTIACIEGRRINAPVMPLVNDEYINRRTKASRGSQMLRDAILRAKGYPVPIVVKRAPPPTPAFEPRRPKRVSRPKSRRGRMADCRSAMVSQIKALVALHFEISVADMESPVRAHRISHPRQIAMYLSRKRTGTSYPTIGKQFGGKDHTSVLFAVRAIEARIEAGDEATIKAIHAVHAVIGS